MPRSIDPIERVLGYGIRKEEQRKRQRRRSIETARQFLGDDPELEEPASASFVETVDELPEEDEDFLGRQFRVVTGDEDEEPRTVELARLPDGTLEWRDINQPRGLWSAQFISSFGAEGLGNGQFGTDSIRGLAVYAGSDVFVASDDRVQKFSANGTYEATLASAGSGAGQVSVPWGLAISKQGYLVVSDSGNARLLIFTLPTGFLVETIDSSSPAIGGGTFGAIGDYRGVAWGSLLYGGHPDLYAIETGLRDTLQWWNDPVGSWAYEGLWMDPTVYDLSAPNGIATDTDGQKWIVDSGNNRIIVIRELLGSTTFIVGALGSSNGQFNSPHSVAIDAFGNAWVTDSGNHRIQVFDSQGVFLAKFGEFGSGDGQFTNPTAIVITDEYVYIADSGNNRVQMWTNPVTTRYALASQTEKIVGVSNKVWNPGGINANGQTGDTVTVAGALTSDIVEWSHTGAIGSPLISPMLGFVTAANTVQVRYRNFDSAIRSVGSGTVYVVVKRAPGMPGYDDI